MCMYVCLSDFVDTLCVHAPVSKDTASPRTKLRVLGSPETGVIDPCELLVLGTEPGSSSKAVRVISPAPAFKKLTTFTNTSFLS